MSQKNETPVLVLSLLITVGLIAGGLWWFTKKSGFNLGKTTSSQSENSTDGGRQTLQPSGKNFASVQNVPTGLFTYGGSTSWAPIRLAVDSGIQGARPEFRLRYVEPSSGDVYDGLRLRGSGSGIKSLIDGQLSFAQSSRPVEDQELARAKQRGFDLKQIPVAIDGLALAVNPNLNIPGLTVEQLRSIYIGKIRNWNQVGGSNIPIKPYSRRLNDGGTVEIFVQDILGGQGFGANVEFVSTTTQALEKVSLSLGAIYYASAPEVVPQCSIKPLPLGRTQQQYIAPYQEPFVTASLCPGKRNKLNIEAFQSGSYPITRNLFVVVKQNGQIEQQAGVAYANLLLTEQGQELITQTGFVKIR
ncbi:MAG: PstS family phosphate ABC transporter substrate-binding protein [Tolypothrix brevis GSE-NOS-MK-07-07A]|jgi:phosphate transport system substrate-binding protein|nr:PstS family phosphate ABC transporter substrate-binding protein [Tolypothrix brevis GSE-NOS-MK-07-07A]